MFACGNESAVKEGDGMTLLDDNTVGGAVNLRPIRFLFVVV
jgi:hypothetical protein